MSRVPLSTRRNPMIGLAGGLRRMARGSATGQFGQSGPVRPRVQADVLAAAASGAAVTGWAGYLVSFSGVSITSANTGFIHSSSVTLDDSSGDTGVYATTTDGILLNPGIYITSEFFTLTPTTNAVIGDIHQVSYSNIETLVLAGVAPATAAPGNLFVVTSGSGTIIPCFQIYCTGGTNRSYSLSSSRVYVQIVRFDLP